PYRRVGAAVWSVRGHGGARPITLGMTLVVGVLDGTKISGTTMPLAVKRPVRWQSPVALPRIAWPRGQRAGCGRPPRQRRGGCLRRRARQADARPALQNGIDAPLAGL